MEDKELERILQEKADNVKVRNFSEVWQEIKGEIEGEKVIPTKTKKLGWKRWLSLLLASCTIMVAIILAPFLLKEPKPAPEEIFYTDELSKQIVSVDELFDGLSQSNITHVDFSNYTVYDSILCLSEDNEIKGAEIKLYCDTGISFFALMQLYTTDVELNIEAEKDYDESYISNSLRAYYSLKDSSAEYIYDIYAVCNGVQYVIEYTGLSDNITEFLETFFG